MDSDANDRGNQASDEPTMLPQADNDRAVQAYAGLVLLQKLWAQATLPEDEAMALAIDASKEVRRAMRS